MLDSPMCCTRLGVVCQTAIPRRHGPGTDYEVNVRQSVVESSPPVIEDATVEDEVPRSSAREDDRERPQTQTPL